MKKILTTTALSLGVAVALNANAETTSQQEFGAISKITSLCHTFKGQDISIAIVYNKSKPESITDKDVLVGYAKSAGFNVSELEISNIDSVNTNLVILANGLFVDDQVKVANATADKAIITASSDLGCVESGNCILGVDVGSVVKLLVNSVKYSKSGLKFDSAFEFMVKQI